MRQPDTTTPSVTRTKRITLVGCGAIGSPAAPLLGKLPQVSQLQLIDGDTYTEGNVPFQAIGISEVGRPKAWGLARRVQQQCPGVAVSAIPRWIENVPLGWLHSDVIVACVDSRRARCIINECAWRLNIPWIDSGVDAAGWLARAIVYRPGAGRACLLCGWTDADFASIEQSYPCLAGAHAVAATRAPASLGSIAAGLLATQCQLLLSGALQDEDYGRQVLWDCRHHRCLVTSYRPHPHCRFDHDVWQIETPILPRHMSTLGDLLQSLRGYLQADLQAIRVVGQSFVQRLMCPACRAERAQRIHLSRGLTPGRLRCRKCGAAMVAAGFDTTDWLTPSTLSRRRLQQSLSSIGLLMGDVLAVQTSDGWRYVEWVDERHDWSDAPAEHDTSCVGRARSATERVTEMGRETR